VPRVTDLVLRFLLGGVIVSCFSLCGEVLRPKRFAGLFGAAPSVALATLPMTLRAHGHLYAATEARSMIAGAVAFLVYACCVSRVLIRYKPSTLLTTTALLPLWIGVAAGLYLAFLRGTA
jgi:hypothetical protein